MAAFHETQSSLLLLGLGNVFKPAQGVSVAALRSPRLAGRGLPGWGRAVCAGTGGSALRGTGFVAKAGMFPACLHVSAPASPGSSEQTGIEVCISLINGFVARPAQ